MSEPDDPGLRSLVILGMIAFGLAFHLVLAGLGWLMKGGR